MGLGGDIGVRMQVGRPEGRDLTTQAPIHPPGCHMMEERFFFGEKMLSVKEGHIDGGGSESWLRSMAAGCGRVGKDVDGSLRRGNEMESTLLPLPVAARGFAEGRGLALPGFFLSK